MVKNKLTCLNFSKAFFRRQLFFREALIQRVQNIFNRYLFSKQKIDFAVKIKEFKKDLIRD